MKQGLSDTARKIIKEHASTSDWEMPEVLYHGTMSEEAAKNIIKNGFKKGDNDFEAVSLSHNYDEALDYADGDPNRVIAVKNNKALTDLGVDGKDKLTGEIMIHPEELNKAERKIGRATQKPKK
jgi:RNA:NAD 2'-phosphotransferase (TPT1/KptA family)